MLTTLKNKVHLSKALALLGSILLIISLFLPFASATDDYKDYLEAHPDRMADAEINMTNQDAIDLSLVDFGRIYAYGTSLEGYETLSMICLVIIIVYALCALLSVLWGLLNKPILLLLTNLLAMGAFSLLKWDFSDRGVIPSSQYHWGFAQYACYLGILLLFIGAVMIFLEKRKQKRKTKQGESL